MHSGVGGAWVKNVKDSWIFICFKEDNAGMCMLCHLGIKALVLYLFEERVYC